MLYIIYIDQRKKKKGDTMPKGVYDRQMTASHINAVRGNLQKAVEALRLKGIKDTPRSLAAKKRNAQKAVRVRVARAILRHFPFGAKAGEEFKASNDVYTVIDEKPWFDTDQRWKQRFKRQIRVKVGAEVKQFEETITIAWDYEPTVENLLILPIVEERESGEGM